MATTETWLQEFRKHAPQLLDIFEKGASAGYLSEKEQIRKIYNSVSADSILFKTPGINLITESTITNEDNSPPVIT